MPSVRPFFEGSFRQLTDRVTPLLAPVAAQVKSPSPLSRRAFLFPRGELPDLHLELGASKSAATTSLVTGPVPDFRKPTSAALSPGRR